MKIERKDLLERFNTELAKSDIRPKDILELLEFMDDEDLFSSKGVTFYHKFLKEYAKSLITGKTSKDFDLNNLRGGLLPVDETAFNLDVDL